VHVPFCGAICPYCDFAVRRPGAGERARYLSALEREAEHWGKRWTRSIDTVYLGGGTPSALDDDGLARLVAHLRAALPLTDASLLFMEVNPEDVRAERCAAWRALGVGFLSLGVQSFDNHELRRLGRRHRGVEASVAVECCLAAGFETVSADLIFGLPGQQPSAWAANLDTLTALGPEHVSCYQLTIHEGTPYGRGRQRGRLHELSEAKQAELYHLAHERLGRAGYEAYEVSNFSRGPGHRSRHNQKYWMHAPYLGLGPSAHSFDGRRRWWNERALPAYLAAVQRVGSAVVGSERLSQRDLALETLMLRLRTAEGLDLEDFRGRFEVDLRGLNVSLIESLCANRLTALDGSWLRPTAGGMAVADGLVARFRLD